MTCNIIGKWGTNQWERSFRPGFLLIYQNCYIVGKRGTNQWERQFKPGFLIIYESCYIEWKWGTDQWAQNKTQFLANCISLEFERKRGQSNGYESLNPPIYKKSKESGVNSNAWFRSYERFQISYMICRRYREDNTVKWSEIQSSTFIYGVRSKAFKENRHGYRMD